MMLDADAGDDDDDDDDADDAAAAADVHVVPICTGLSSHPTSYVMCRFPFLMILSGSDDSNLKSQIPNQPSPVHVFQTVLFC
jgi:hypothetical protein